MAIGYFPGGTDWDHQRFLAFCSQRGFVPKGWFTGEHNLEEAITRLEEGDTLVVPSPHAIGSRPVAAAWNYLRAVAKGAQVIEMERGEDVGLSIVAFASTSSRGAKVRQAMAQRALHSRVLGRSPFGYQVGPENRLQVHPQEGEVVRLIFRLYVQERMGLRRLAQHLNSQGIATRSGRPWTVAAVRELLRNRVYVGTYHRFGVRVPASHPPLVSYDDYNRAQELLTRRGGRGGRRQSQEVAFLLSGLAYCAYCQGRMVGVRRYQRWQRRDGLPQENVYLYYQCGSRLNRSLCDYHTWRAHELEGEVVRRLQAGEAETGSGAQERRTHLQRLERLLREVSQGLISYQEWRQKGLSLIEPWLLMDEGIARKMLARWDELTFSQKRQALLRLVERVDVWDDQIKVTVRG